MPASITGAQATGGSWFLLAIGGTASIRVGAGLTLGEDHEGHLALGSDNPESAWVVFEIDEAGLWLRLASDRWCFRMGGQTLPERIYVDDTIRLRLPHHGFNVSSVLLDPTDRERIEVAVCRRGSAEGSVDGSAEAREARAEPRRIIPDRSTVVPFPARSDDSGPRRERKEPVATSVDLPTLALQPVVFIPRGASRSGQYRRPQRSRRRTAKLGGRLVFRVLTRLLLLIGCLVIPGGSLWIEGTAGEADADTVAVAAGGGEAAAVVAGALPNATAAPTAQGHRALLDGVEALLQEQRPADRQTLVFATEAYRLAMLKDPDDAALVRRYAELKDALTALEAESASAVAEVVQR